MQFPTWISKTLKSGAVTIGSNDVKAIQLRLKEKNLDLNILDKTFLKKVLKDGPKGGSLLDLIRLIKDFAENLQDEDYTITVSYQGMVVLALGSDASSRVFNLVAGIDGVEVKNLGKMFQLAL